MKYTILKNRPRGMRASAIVIKDDQILLMRQVFNGEEFYNIPGGSVEEGEFIEDACIREVKEEFSIDVTVKRLIYIVDSESRMNFVFSCEYQSGTPTLGGPEQARMNELDQYYVSWENISQLEKLNITPLATKEALIRYLCDTNQPTFMVNTYTHVNNTILIV
jgi:8-oxo-dGTP diphosphatase